MARNLMIDLETLGTRSDAAIVSIGAAIFDPETDTVEEGGFYEVVSRESVVERGQFSIDAATLSWWMRQSDAARAVFQERGSDIMVALDRFRAYFDRETSNGAFEGVWGNGATFDNVVLGNAYRTMQLPIPWSYRQDQCFRTLRKLYPEVPVPDFEGTTHNALDDAVHQARWANRILRHRAKGSFRLELAEKLAEDRLKMASDRLVALQDAKTVLHEFETHCETVEEFPEDDEDIALIAQASRSINRELGIAGQPIEFQKFVDRVYAGLPADVR